MRFLMKYLFSLFSGKLVKVSLLYWYFTSDLRLHKFSLGFSGREIVGDISVVTASLFREEYRHRYHVAAAVAQLHHAASRARCSRRFYSMLSLVRRTLRFAYYRALSASFGQVLREHYRAVARLRLSWSVLHSSF